MTVWDKVGYEPVWRSLGYASPGDFWGLQEKAYRATRLARRSGALTIGPCERRGEGYCAGRIEAHHEDYEKPLEVTWLCRRHHVGLHTEKNRIRKAWAA